MCLSHRMYIPAPLHCAIMGSRSLLRDVEHKGCCIGSVWTPERLYAHWLPPGPVLGAHVPVDMSDFADTIVPRYPLHTTSQVALFSNNSDVEPALSRLRELEQALGLSPYICSLLRRSCHQHHLQRVAVEAKSLAASTYPGQLTIYWSADATYRAFECLHSAAIRCTARSNGSLDRQGYSRCPGGIMSIDQDVCHPWRCIRAGNQVVDTRCCI